MRATWVRLVVALLVVAAAAAPSWVSRAGALSTDTQTVDVSVVVTAPPTTP
jgi:hypothetical protein